jgi:hypothetical protein
MYGPSITYPQEKSIMRKTFQKSSPMLALVLAGMFTAAPVYADKPDWGR